MNEQTNQFRDVLNHIRRRQQHLEREPEEPDYFEAEQCQRDWICQRQSLTVEQRQGLKAQFQRFGSKA